MKTPAFAIALLLSASASATSAAPASPAPSAVCNVKADVTDIDPKGLNVRSAPGGAVLTRLVDRGDWIEVHITGLHGDWYEIDRANQISNDNPDIDGVMWRGKGYVHKSTVGISGLQQGTAIYADHDLKSRVLVRSADGDQATELLGCWQDFYKVRIKAGTGWTKGACTNQNTTCS